MPASVGPKLIPVDSAKARVMVLALDPVHTDRCPSDRSPAGSARIARVTVRIRGSSGTGSPGLWRCELRTVSMHTYWTRSRSSSRIGVSFRWSSISISARLIRTADG
ncbi:hypothetical protein ACFWIA_28115 [Streptomyces sp. NPDC127068]|uniref:hypothetical protein n=1 Tax=Streptomyces sp. NPDC127068 TaxID=3347127 RepID=UPI003665118A